MIYNWPNVRTLELKNFIVDGFVTRQYMSQSHCCLFWFWARPRHHIIKASGNKEAWIDKYQDQNVHHQVSRWSAAEDILLPPLDWPGVCEEDMQQVAGAQWRQHSPAQPSEAVSREMGQWGSSSIKWWDIFCSSTRNMIITSKISSKCFEDVMSISIRHGMSICPAFWPLSLLAIWPSKF